MVPRPPRSTPTDTPFPYPTLFRAVPLAFQLFPEPVHRDDEFAERGDRIMAGHPRRPSGVSIHPFDPGFAISRAAGDPLDDRDRQAVLDQDGALFDVRLDRKSTRLNSSH